MAKTQINRPTRHPAVAVVASAAIGIGSMATAHAADDDAPSVTPYRPSVSTPAALSAPGWVELEAGGSRERGNDAARRDSLPVTIKLAFSPDWGVRLGGDAWVRQTDERGQRRSGGGDTSVVLKRRFAVDEASAFGLEAGVNLPTGRHGLGSSSGQTDYSVNTIYSADLGRLHTDLNLMATRLGAFDPGTSRWQGLWAASLSGALDDQWGLVGEFSGTSQRGAGGSTQFLAAASYSVSKSLVLDAGAARSLRSGAPDWSLFAGFTVLCGRLF